MKITTKRLKEIIMEEVKALSENAPAEEIEEARDDRDDAQVMRDIEHMLETLKLSDEVRNELERILNELFKGRYGRDDKPSPVEPNPLASLSMDHYGMSTPSFEEGLTKKDLARIIHEETVKAIKEGGQVINKDGEMIFTDTDGDASDKARMAARRNDYEKVLEKIANMIKSGKPQLAYDEALKMLSASSEKGRERANAIEPEDALGEENEVELEEKFYGGAYDKSRYTKGPDGKERGEQSANTGSRQKDSSTSRDRNRHPSGR
tara:strand:- start:200 stop:991 length:792 start_codon:yes stop_codon:yes gene_type:complete